MTSIRTKTPGEGATPVLEARSISKVYGSGSAAFQALDRVSMSIDAGESVAIVGKSGSGKSTLMHLIGLLDDPDEGEVLVDGQRTGGMSVAELDILRNRRFGFIFQQFFLSPTQTVLQNVVTPMKIAGIGAKERNARGRELLEQVGLADKADNKATDISGGQKQRVAVARALAMSPAVIFADEPTGNLDSESGALITDLLFGLNEGEGITLVVVTHDGDLADRCGRRLRMTDGRLGDEAGTTREGGMA
ncbi:putative ABC transport system ATP-binding protein [Micrococcus sp. 140720015-1]